MDAIEGVAYNDVPSKIYLAESPADGSRVTLYKSQDYLVSVPDPDIMLLLGTAFILLSLWGRKKAMAHL